MSGHQLVQHPFLIPDTFHFFVFVLLVPIFQIWFRYFEYVVSLTHCIILIFSSTALIWSLSTPAIEHLSMRNFQYKTSQTIFNMFTHSKYLLHKLHNLSFFFLHLSCLLTFLTIKKHIMPKCCLFSPIFNVTINKKKYLNFNRVVFKMHWYDSCQSFWMKLK